MNYVAPAIDIVLINTEDLIATSLDGTENNAGIGFGGGGNKPSNSPSRDWNRGW